MRIVVAGSRTFTDTTMMGLEMSRWDHLGKDVTIVSGGARGADTLAAGWADSLGYEYEEFPADWEKYGRGAGMIRNRWMIDT